MRYLLFACTCLLVSSPLFAQETCEKSQADLDLYLRSLPKVCRQDSDCSGQYLRVDTCKPAVVFNQSAMTTIRQKRLETLQNATRFACTSEWQKHPACSAIPFQASCFEGQCTDISIKGTLATTPKATWDSLPNALVMGQCAPWDGPAIALYFTPTHQTCGKIAFPYVAIQIYAELDHLSGRTIKLDGWKIGQAHRCASEGQCEAATSGEITFDAYDSNGPVTGHYEVKFRDGDVVRGTFHAEWCHERIVCG